MSGSAPMRPRRSTCISASGPGSGLPAAIAVAMACGAVIGFLAFRFGVAGVYFAILTIAFAEFARIGFDHFRWVGGSSGFFLPVANYARNDLWNLRGNPAMFYYVMLALTVAAFVLCHVLLKSRMGYLLAGDPRGRGRRPLARHQHLPLQDVRGGHFRRHDRDRRRVLRVLLQQSLPRAGLSHRALDRADPRARSSAASAPCSARSSAPSC